MEILHSLALARGVTQRMWSARQHGDKCEVLACSVLVLACNVLYCTVLAVSHDKTLSNQTIGTQSLATFLRSQLSRASNESLQRLKLYNHRKDPYQSLLLTG